MPAAIARNGHQLPQLGDQKLSGNDVEQAEMDISDHARTTLQKSIRSREEDHQQGEGDVG